MEIGICPLLFSYSCDYRSNWTPLGGAIGLGVSSILGLLAAYIVIKPNDKYILYDSDRLTQQIRQLVYYHSSAALGTFTVSGVGDVIERHILFFYQRAIIL